MTVRTGLSPRRGAGHGDADERLAALRRPLPVRRQPPLTVSPEDPLNGLIAKGPFCRARAVPPGRTSRPVVRRDRPGAHRLRRPRTAAGGAPADPRPGRAAPPRRRPTRTATYVRASARRPAPARATDRPARRPRWGRSASGWRRGAARERGRIEPRVDRAAGAGDRSRSAPCFPPARRAGTSGCVICGWTSVGLSPPTLRAWFTFPGQALGKQFDSLHADTVVLLVVCASVGVSPGPGVTRVV